MCLTHIYANLFIFFFFYKPTASLSIFEPKKNKYSDRQASSFHTWKFFPVISRIFQASCTCPELWQFQFIFFLLSDLNPPAQPVTQNPPNNPFDISKLSKNNNNPIYNIKAKKVNQFKELQARWIIVESLRCEMRFIKDLYIYNFWYELQRRNIIRQVVGKNKRYEYVRKEAH